MLNYAKAGLAGLALLSSAEVSLPLCCTNAPDTQIRQNNSLFPPLAIVWWSEACVSHDAVLLLLVVSRVCGRGVRGTQSAAPHACARTGFPAHLRERWAEARVPDGVCALPAPRRPALLPRKQALRVLPIVLIG